MNRTQNTIEPNECATMVDKEQRDEATTVRTSTQAGHGQGTSSGSTSSIVGIVVVDCLSLLLLSFKNPRRNDANLSWRCRNPDGLLESGIR